MWARALRIVSREKTLRFKNTFIIILLRLPVYSSRLALQVDDSILSLFIDQKEVKLDRHTALKGVGS